MRSLAQHCDRLESLALMDDLTDRHERLERRKLWRGRIYTGTVFTGLCATFAYTLTGYLNGYAA